MTVSEIMQELAALGSEQTKRTLMRHGAVEPFFGVKIGDMKPLVKKLKGQQELALGLYATGNSDAMYLAGLVANGAKMSLAELEAWAAAAPWHMIAGCTVAWVASEHPEAVTLAQKWVDTPQEMVAVAGWSTLAAVVSTVADAALPEKALNTLLAHCVKHIAKAPNRVKYAMNGYVISLGTYSAPLGEAALQAAQKIGEVTCDMGDTACKVPVAADYILKSRGGAAVAAKRKTARC
jgi:3-methyladenine DNA glycosylase AlkD